MADENKEKVLYYLDELSDYKIDSDYSDIRGWEVVDADNRTIGEVDNLLVNKDAERVVYLDVEVDDSLAAEARKMQDLPANEGAHGFMNEEGENHLIIPVGVVSLDEDNKKVFTKDIGHDKFIRTQWFSKGAHIDRDYEMRTFRNYFPDGTLEDSRNRDFYNRREFGHNRI
jgi:sporulation protein YlmC with PRC-barrel domain